MDDELRERLRRLGVVKGLGGLKSPSPKAETTLRGRTARLPGREVEREDGVFWLDHRVYPGDHVHGRYPLSALAEVRNEALTLLDVAELGPRPAFLDTETTGLAGGAGTLAFLIGVGVWEPTGLKLHLIFMRDPEEEATALSYLSEVLSDATGLVTFNGLGFDVPILQSRYILNRMAPTWVTMPHLDLLSVARRLWRDHLPSRALQALEQEILGIGRSEEDLPSFLIPQFYRDYLDTGDTTQIKRIFYHNEIDVLSLATLMAHVSQMVCAPREMTLAPAEWAGIGRVYDSVGREDAAVEAWHRAVSGELGELDEACASRLWQEMGLRYKRREAWKAAFEMWESWIASIPWAVDPLVEEAKYYEWTAHDLTAALACTERAIRRAGKAPRGMKRLKTLQALRHRRDRLQRKLAREEA